MATKESFKNNHINNISSTFILFLRFYVVSQDPRKVAFRKVERLRPSIHCHADCENRTEGR